MTVARAEHTATLLGNDDVLVSGGYGIGGSLSSTELYHPATAQWSGAGDLSVPRRGHAATLLLNGNVLVTGGYSSNGVVDTAEIYDSGSRKWKLVANMNGPRSYHSTTRLLDGSVLLVGGQDLNGTPTAAAERYNPTLDQWSSTGGMTDARVGHTATLLPTGQVLVSGGRDSTGPIGSAELFDPNTGWNQAGKLNVARTGHTATVLGSGDILVVGGYGKDGGALASAEIYHILNPTTGQGQWVVANNLHVPRSGHSATLLSSSTVFVAGGKADDGILTSSELYDATTDLWVFTSSLSVPRTFHAATLLQDGSFLITGGIPLRSDRVSAELVAPNVLALLEWDQVSDPAVLGYKLYYGTTPKSYQGFAILDREVKYAFGNLTRGTTYYFAVTGFGWTGESCSSNEVKFTP
jgi:Kelch motif/Galactose oxidase, central domain